MTFEIARRALDETVQPLTRYLPSSRDIVRPPERRPSGNHLLSELSRLTAGKLAPYLRRVFLRRDEFLYTPEDDIASIYFPETTVFTEHQMLRDGRTVEVSMTGKESAVGLVAALSAERASTWVQPYMNGTALRIGSKAFREIALREPELLKAVGIRINAYIKQISQRVICNTHHPMEGRLCTWLLMLADRCPAGPLKLTHEQMARVLGVFRPSISCAAASLRDRGLIDYVRGNVLIRNSSEMKKAACGCYEEVRVA